MKNILKFFVTASIISLIAGCKEYEMITYDQQGRVNFITYDSQGSIVSDPYYFEWEKNFGINSRGDSLRVDTLRIGARIMGQVSDQSRKVAFKVINTTSTDLEVEYMPEGYEIPAGKSSAKFKVVIKRPALRNVEYKANLVFDFDQSDFIQGTIEHQVFKIESSDIVNMELWKCTASDWEMYVWDLGTYSEAKIRFIINVLGVLDFTQWAPYFDINNTWIDYVDFGTLYDTWVDYKAKSLANPAKYPPFYDETKLPAQVWIEFPEPWW